MTSQFTWLDVDEEQRRRMLQVVDHFKTEGTVDELGIGQIRDAIADQLFPGTSVLQTRLRYFLLIPWALSSVVTTPTRAGTPTARLRQLEVRTIHALLNGDDKDGVIGRDAKDKLKRMPSAAYWAGLRRFGIVTTDASIEGWFRRASVIAEVEGDEGVAVARPRVTGLDPDLPPAPADWLDTCTPALTAGEADFLRDRIVRSTQDSLLAWMAVEGTPPAVPYAWDHPDVARFPASLARLVEHGRRLHHLVHGAALLYNLMLAREVKNEELEVGYADTLAAWAEELAHDKIISGWDRNDLWAAVSAKGVTVRPGVQRFLTGWWDIVAADAEIASDQWAQRLVRERERTLKGSRSRFDNPGARSAWQGASGLVRLDYRWQVAQRLLTDLAAPELAA